MYKGVQRPEKGSDTVKLPLHHSITHSQDTGCICSSKFNELHSKCLSVVIIKMQDWQRSMLHCWVPSNANIVQVKQLQELHSHGEVDWAFYCADARLLIHASVGVSGNAFSMSITPLNTRHKLQSLTEIYFVSNKVFGLKYSIPNIQVDREALSGVHSNSRARS